VAATRQLAKRQFTWLRAMAAEQLDPYADDALDALLRSTEHALAGRRRTEEDWA